MTISTDPWAPGPAARSPRGTQQRDAQDDVLDTYQSERHPIGKRVLRQSGMMARGVTLHPRIARAVRNLLAPRLLRRSRVRDAVAGSFAGTELRYPHRRGEHPLVDTRATEIPL